MTEPKRQPITRLAWDRLSRAERSAGRGAFLTDAHQGGWTPATTTTVGRQHAPAHIAELLDLDDNREVITRERVMRADGKVVMLSTSYLPADLAASTVLEQVDTGPGGLYARLEDMGHALSHFQEIVGARPPQPGEADLLLIPRNYPLLAVTRVAHTVVGPVEVNEMRLGADRYQLVYTWPAE